MEEVNNMQSKPHIGTAIIIYSLADNYSALSIDKDGNIGNGAFGVVFKATFKGSRCAAKMLTPLAMEMITGIKTRKIQVPALESFRKECAYLKSLEHNNIVCHIATVTEPNSNLPILVMELMDCSLKQYLGEKQHHKIPSHQELSLCSDIVHGLAFLHSCDIIHRDLCDDNVLLKVSGATSTAKISDFGMSTILPHESMSKTLTGLGHRQVYLPPEAMDDPYHYSHTLDVYSFGVLATQILRAKVNIRSKKELLAILQTIPEIHGLKNIIHSCLSENKSDRPQAADIVKQIPWTCDYCEFLNPVTETTCETCGIHTPRNPN